MPADSLCGPLLGQAQLAAGSDPLCVAHEAYPGVAEFFLALSVGRSTGNDRLNPALLSARPASAFTEDAVEDDINIIKNAKGVFADQLKRDDGELAEGFRNYQERPLRRGGGLQPLPAEPQEWTVNFGGSKGGKKRDFFTKNTPDWHKAMGDRKVESVKEEFVRKIDKYEFEDACVVFVGDDGQGDCEAAAGMRMREKSSGGTFAMRAAFIHKLKTSEAKLNCKAKSYDEEGWSGGLRLETPAEEDGELDGPTYLPPIIYFDTYLDAAHAAFRMGLIQQQGLRDVYTAVTKFNAVRDPHCEALPPLLRRGHPSGCNFPCLARVRGMPLARPSTLASSSPAQVFCKDQETRKKKVTNEGCGELEKSIKAFIDANGALLVDWGNPVERV